MENFPEYVASVFAEANLNVCLSIGELAKTAAEVIDIMNVNLHWLQLPLSKDNIILLCLFVCSFILF